MKEGDDKEEEKKEVTNKNEEEKGSNQNKYDKSIDFFDAISNST